MSVGRGEESPSEQKDPCLGAPGEVNTETSKASRSKASHGSRGGGVHT